MHSNPKLLPEEERNRIIDAIGGRSWNNGQYSCPRKFAIPEAEGMKLQKQEIRIN